MATLEIFRPSFMPPIGLTPYRPVEVWMFGPLPVPPPTPPPIIPPSLPLPSAIAAIQTRLSAQYGVDVLCLTDLDPNLSLTPNALPQDLYHLITEAPGTLFWSTTKTFSVLNLLSQGFTPAGISNIQSAIQAVISADQRVAQCQVSTTFNGVDTLSVTISVVPQSGQPFNFVVAIDKVSITLISVGLSNL